jgi:hypothetical protein
MTPITQLRDLDAPEVRAAWHRAACVAAFSFGALITLDIPVSASLAAAIGGFLTLPLELRTRAAAWQLGLAMGCAEVVVYTFWWLISL